MSSNAVAGVGAQFKRGSVAIAEVKSIGGPNLGRDMIDVTSLDSSGGYREYIPGFRDGGEITLSMNFTFDGYDDFKSDIESDSGQSYSLVFPDSGATTFTFSGYVTALSLNTAADDAISAEVTIKISGEVTLTA